jgi:ribose/xylose/arabinose/galactoside ABC-type transport system permease subunit
LEKREDLRGGFRARLRSVFRHENANLGIVLLALIFGIGGLTRGGSLSIVNASNVLLQSSIRGITAVGQAFVILTAGIDVSVGGNALFCSIMGTALMSTDWQSIVGHPLSPGLGVLLMILAGLGWGTVNSTLVSRVGIPALISTLGLWQITTGAAFSITQGKTIGGVPESLAWWGQGTVGLVPVPVIIFILVAIVAYYVLNYTSYGRAVYATGGNPTSAWLSGINVPRILFSVYAIAGFLAGLASFIQLGRIMSASMMSLEGLEIDSIAAVTIGGVSLMGGRGNLIGVVLGTLIIGVVNNGLSVLRAGPPAIRIAKGAIIILAVAIDYIRRQRE